MTIVCCQGVGQCRTLDADMTIGCYYGDYSSCDNTIPTSFLFGANFFSLTLVCLFSFLREKSYCIAAFLDEYPLPDSLELKAFMLTLACLLSITFWTENPLPENDLLKRNC